MGAQHSFGEGGLRETVEWYGVNRARWEPIKSGDYRRFYEEQYAERLRRLKARTRSTIWAGCSQSPPFSWLRSTAARSLETAGTGGCRPRRRGWATVSG